MPPKVSPLMRRAAILQLIFTAMGNGPLRVGDAKLSCHPNGRRSLPLSIPRWIDTSRNISSIFLSPRANFLGAKISITVVANDYHLEGEVSLQLISAIILHSRPNGVQIDARGA